LTLRAALALLALGLPQDPPPAPQDQGGAREADEAGEVQGPVLLETAPQLDFRAPLGPGELALRFDTIAARFPALAASERLPVSGGAPIPLLVLGERTGDPDRRPALLFYGWGEEGSVATALAAAEELLGGPPEAPAALLLERVTLYLLPALAPEGVPAAAAVIPSLNFPIGWRPASVVPGAGSVPLSVPAARALAAFLQSHGNLSLAVALEESPCTGPEGADIDAPGYRGELGVFLAGEAGAEEHLSATSLCPGTAASFAWAARGVFPARLAGPPPLDALEGARAVLRARGVVRAAERLPCLAIGEPSILALRPGQVRLDLRVENTGALPTLSCLGAERRLAGTVELSVEGGRVLACAAAEESAALHVRSPTGGAYALGEIPAGGAVEIFLVVEAEPGAELVLRCASPRAGSASRTLRVP
jgi:hypothetical protein